MAQAKKDEKEKLAPIVIKRIKKGGGGHHGGAWKVAYADFVTAMMAFFLLLWLLNVTTDEQKNAISNYFDPSHPKVSDVVSGAGGILGGMTVSPVGAMVSNVQPLVQQEQPVTTTRGMAQGEKTPVGDMSEDELAKELRAKEDARFNQAADKLKAEIAASPDLKDLQKNLLIDITPEGLRIQIVDDQGRSMFPSGSAVMYDFMRKLLLKVSAVITPLPNQVSVRGHTDSNKYKDPSNYDNWNLSADRAQASRRVMVIGGLPEKRIENVMGRSDREPLEKDPSAPRNRRISIILLRERLTKDTIEKLKSAKEKTAADAAAKAVAGQAAAASGVGLQIIDDTKPAPAKDAAGKAPDAPAYSQPEPSTPLPITPNAPSNFKQQPQVMYFNNDRADHAESLYEGPAQSPYDTTGAPVANPGPPIIHKKLFDLGDDDDAPAPKTETKTPAPAIVVTPIAPTPAQKSVTFGDAVPDMAAPIAPAALPPAAPVQLDNSKATPVTPTDAPKTLQFDDAPVSAAPAQQPELQLINPALSKKVLNFGDVPATPAPAAPAENAPSSTAKQLNF